MIALPSGMAIQSGASLKPCAALHNASAFLPRFASWSALVLQRCRTAPTIPATQSGASLKPCAALHNASAFLPRYASWSALVLQRFRTASTVRPPKAALP